MRISLLHGQIIPLLLLFQLSAAQIPIGQWREHLNYQKTIQVLKGDQIYCATESALFGIDEKNEITRYSKISGLHDIGISCIGWDDFSQQLIIAYLNSNLDIIDGSIFRNLPDILNSRVNGNKKINSIYCKDGLAYLSTGLGIIVVDLIKHEIKDTWIIGKNGAQTMVHSIAIDSSTIYAATDEGLKKAVFGSADPANYQNWITLSGTNGLNAGPIVFTSILNGKLIIKKADSIFQFSKNWNLLYHDPTWPIINSALSSNKLLLTQKNNAGDARVLVINQNGTIEKIINNTALIKAPKCALAENNAVWVADEIKGLTKLTGNNSPERFVPNGPEGISTGAFVFSNEKMFVAAGSVDADWNNLNNRDGIFELNTSGWSAKNYLNIPLMDSVNDILSLATDPVDKTIWAGSFGGGLLHFGKTTTLYKQNNSPIQASVNTPGSYRIAGLAFDSQQNLWISNYGAAQPIKVRKKDGSWKSFSIPFPINENAVGQLLHDEIQRIWIVGPKNNGIICYQYGESIDATSDDVWKWYRQGSGNGNLPGNNVLCIAKDKNNSIWVGSTDGIAIINCTDRIINSPGCEAVLPIVQQDQFAGYLFKGEMVQCIAVDGANRKWIGTKKGAWLMSENGEKIVYQFNDQNSPLLNNDVKKIGIDPVSGEVFFATAAGICSFRSTSTEGKTSLNNVLIFPNPVPPNYNGTIAIKGLTDHALIKITELNGRLVFQTRALGGQAIWNGKDYLGNKIASGIYLVMIKNENGDDKIVSKIIITGGR